MRILILEDEPQLLHTLQQGLEENGWTVDAATDGLEGLAFAKHNTYNVIVSDVKMPNMTGLDFLREIRVSGIRTPVLLLTALGQTEDKIAGFDAGTDDYLTKPFDFQELMMRVRALARRPVDTYRPESILRFADFEINLATKEARRGDVKINLTPREFDLMEYLLKNPGRVISKAEIAEKVWNLDFDTGTNFVEVYVNFLRKKIESDFPTKLIHTQFKMGYILKEE
jgi:two-component system, OmpR family, copper resistance phosphate regulon response regulator CusR